MECLDLSLHTQPDMHRRVWHFNVAFIGSCRAGKTKLLQRFVDSQFSDIYSQTTETSFVSKSVSIGRHHVVFQCWDTAGSARSGCLDSRLDQLHAVFIVFDASRDAIADLEHWHHLATAAATTEPNGPLLVMVANKTDLGCHGASMTRARDLCRARHGLVFTLSVLTDEENLEVDAMMLEVGKALTERHAAETAVVSVADAAEATDVVVADRATDAASAASAATSRTPPFSGDGAAVPLMSPSPAAAIQWAPQTSLPVVERQPSAAATPDVCGHADGDAASNSPTSKVPKPETLENCPAGCSDADSQADEKKGWRSCCCACW